MEWQLLGVPLMDMYLLQLEKVYQEGGDAKGPHSPFPRVEIGNYPEVSSWFQAN